MRTDHGVHTIVDLHSDIPLDIAIRRARGEREVFRHYHYQKLQRSGVRVLIAALWTEPEYREQSGVRLIQLLGSLLADLLECSDVVQLVTSADGVEKALAKGKVAFYLGIEGMSFVENWPMPETADASTHTKQSPWRLQEQLRQSLALLRGHGVQQAILAWGEANAIASGPVPVANGEEVQVRQGLSEFGRHVVHSLVEQDVIIDVTHLDDASTDGVLDATAGYVIASHSNVRALCDVPRNLPDRHIRTIGERSGIIGVNAFAGFLTEGQATVDHYIDHIVYIANLIGIDCVGFGFDFVNYLDYLDYATGMPVTKDLRGVQDVPKLILRLNERGFTDAEIDKLASGNAMHILSRRPRIEAGV